MLFAHCNALAGAQALIVAHDFNTSIDLFKDPLTWARSMPFELPKPTQRKIYFPHAAGASELRIATAGNVISGHGLTLSGLHLSEAARYPGQDSFTSLLPTVSDHDPNSIIIIESTANGKTDDGEAFYNYWESACHGDNGYLPVFLGWLEDPACVRNPDEASDAPSGDVEKELMGRPYKATKAQIAWYRYTMESKCHGLEDVFMEQYPWCPGVAFQVSGDPSFSRAELAYMRETQAEPIAKGHIELVDRDRSQFEPASGGWRIYEHPDDASWYYIGVDAARGTEYGDFACMFIWNGHSGKCAAVYDEKVDPETLTVLANAAGRYYRAGNHCALINVELTGNLGLVTQKRLRDVYYYPNLYFWRGSRDDAAPGKARRASLGWETSYRSRELAFATFRGALAHKRCCPMDKTFIQQAENMQRSGHVFDFEVRKGHDDVFMAGLFGWIAREQYPPPPRAPGSKKPFGGPDEDPKLPFTYAEGGMYAQQLMANTNLDRISRAESGKKRTERVGDL
jgi:hypothetical protein